MSITFSSCFYIFKAKFDPSVYIQWMNNFLSIVNEFNLVIYTDQNAVKHINTNNNPRIKIVIKPLEQFYNYKYKKQWILNHNKNDLLKESVDWKVNMLWSEKIWFVKQTIREKYFDTEMYGWCDIGYFRNRERDLNTSMLTKWANKNAIDKLDKTKIHYACVNNDQNFMNQLYALINNKNSYGLPCQQIPPFQNSIAGGFFILHKSNIDWWLKTYEQKIGLYFKNNYLVKDDQIIIVDCVMSDQNRFSIHCENNPIYDNWFMFQRILM